MGAYPKNWPVIAWEVKRAAGFRCEHCGHPHDPEAGYCLTVHHLDGNPANCAPENLVALCQRCHLRIQARLHPRQLYLLCEPEWLRRRRNHAEVSQ